MKNICVIGAGPAGFYTSRRLLKAGHRVFMLEKSQYPFGLASQGIALDNQELKTALIKEFYEIARAECFSLYCNAPVETRCLLENLMSEFDAVILTTGMSESPSLPHLSGKCVDPLDIVRWYNGYSNDLPFDLSSTKSLSVIGNGNVAMDIVRVFTTDPSILQLRSRGTIKPNVFADLRRSSIRSIFLIGRGDLSQCRFTSPALRDYTTSSTATSTLSTRTYRLLSTPQLLPTSFARKASIIRSAVDPNLDFTESRKVIFLNKSEVVELQNERHSMILRSTENKRFSTVEMPCDVIVPCIGFISTLPDRLGLPKGSHGEIQNLDGRVAFLPNLYTAGWAATGSSGDISVSLRNSNSLSTMVNNDLSGRPNREGHSVNIEDILRRHNQESFRKHTASK